MEKNIEEMKRNGLDYSVYRYEYERYRNIFSELKYIEEILRSSKNFDKEIYIKYSEKYNRLNQEKEELRVILNEKMRKREKGEERE